MSNASIQARQALATLPLSFPDTTGIVFVDGAARWPDEVLRALRSGARGVVLVQPTPVDCAGLLDEEPSTVVVVDSRWASNPVIVPAGRAFRDAAGSGSRVECRVVLRPGSDFASALLDQFVLIRALLGPVTNARVRHLSDRALHADGLTETSIAVDFSIVCTSALPDSATVRLLTSDGSVELLIPSSDTAQPAALTTVGPHGAVLAPTYYENAHRASLRRLHELQATGSADALAELRRLQADVELTTAALGHHISERNSGQ